MARNTLKTQTQQRLGLSTIPGVPRSPRRSLKPQRFIVKPVLHGDSQIGTFLVSFGSVSTEEDVVLRPR